MKNIVIKYSLHLQFLRVLAVMLTFICILKETSSHADVFSFVDEEGTVCFTDSPKIRGAVRIYRERKNPGLEASGRKSRAKKKAGREIYLESSGLTRAISSDMTLPVDGRISSTVGLRHDPIDGQLRFHNGVDIAVPKGTPVKPVAPGTVYFSGIRNGYGNMVTVVHDDGMITIYAHNSLNLVKEGERIGTDTSIALSGSTGRSTGPHLHFEAWKEGSNLTDSFLNAIPAGNTAIAANYPRKDIIRSSVQSDGSLLFTNLP
jgi:murein DD-endopeptidase MepM/ murein hydrolase activator NlpD